ncbi:MAG: nucleotidyltransferase [Candidatus Omnitrophica bacterium]|nr:nucleotidyltransferase [Candidatus Omnitrophota bacterium]
MRVSSDYRDLFKILNRYRVKYLVVGAYAVAYYTEPRFTKDLDIWVKPDMKNAQKVYQALKKFGAPLKNISVQDFTNKKLIYQIGVAPVRVDIIMGIPGISFDRAWLNREKSKYAGISINIIGKKELIKSKRRFKREQDILDLKKLIASNKEE